MRGNVQSSTLRIKINPQGYFNVFTEIERIWKIQLAICVCIDTNTYMYICMYMYECIDLCIHMHICILAMYI